MGSQGGRGNRGVASHAGGDMNNTGSGVGDRDALARVFASIALRAAVPVMRVYARGCDARIKPDASPVTEADEAAERVILDALVREAAGVPVVSEEAMSRGECPEFGAQCILVDPLDGTREFLGRNGEFTINIALVRDGAPVCGAIYAPARDTLWFAGSTAFVVAVRPGDELPDMAAWRGIHSRKPPAAGAVALVSRSHLDPRSERFLDARGIVERSPVGSSLKFCLLAQGDADVYPRFGPTMEWDVAAGDAILRAAGGMVLGEDGHPMIYGSRARDFRNGGFVAWGRAPAA